MASTNPEKPWLHHPKLGEVTRNFVIPGEYCFDEIWHSGVCPASCLVRAKTFEFRDDDVILVGYPKSGTHWMRSIMKYVMQVDENSLQIPYFPFLIDTITTLPSPRTFASYQDVDYFRRPLETKKTKFVVLVRNVKDVLVSFYHFYRIRPELGLFQGTFDEFMEMVKVKRVKSWFDWMLGWGAYKDYPNTIFIKYEDMKRDLHSEIRRLANFLEIDVTEDVIAEVCSKTSFSNMKDKEVNARGITESNPSEYVRKGVVGDWKKYFSDDSNDYVDELYKDIEPLGFHFEFE